MTARRARYLKIERLALEILHQHGVFAPPVPVDMILVKSGLQVKRGDLGDVSGLLVRQGNLAVIGVNSQQRAVRQRFTMAHEFAHFLLHEGLSSHMDRDFKVNYRDALSSEASDVDEIEANFFAACLLMPKPFLDAEEAFEAIDDDEAVFHLARLFNVSQHAMSLRLVNAYRPHRPF